jgi:hypothetical protein
VNNRTLVFLAILMLAAGLPGVLAPRPVLAAGTNYYVDSVNGSDANSGTASSSPWKTLTKIQSYPFRPGDTINFKRGSSWTGGLNITSSGVQNSPITFRDYGTGPRPTISNPGTGQRVIRVYSSWVVIQGFLVKDSGDAGVEIETGANHNTIQDIEVTNTGMGVSIGGQYNLVTNNYAHDLHMVVNTPGGDDDYGAVGFLILNGDNEVSYNRCINCRAPSYDYGNDGGVVEIYSNGDNAYIHHNYGRASEGFIEVGGSVARNVRVSYNVSDNNYSDFACLHVGGTFSSTIDGLRIENNTIVNTTASGWSVLNCPTTTMDATQLVFRNNIVYTNMSVFYQSSFTHVYNVYYVLAGKSIGFPLGSGEQAADPLFVDVNGGNYRLNAYSPAINVGMNLGYSIDFEGRLVPQGGIPDIGAYEWAGTGSNTSQVSLFYLPLLMR